MSVVWRRTWSRLCPPGGEVLPLHCGLLAGHFRPRTPLLEFFHVFPWLFLARSQSTILKHVTPFSLNFFVCFHVSSICLGSSHHVFLQRFAGGVETRSLNKSNPCLVRQVGLVVVISYRAQLCWVGKTPLSMPWSIAPRTVSCFDVPWFVVQQKCNPIISKPLVVVIHRSQVSLFQVT